MNIKELKFLSVNPGMEESHGPLLPYVLILLVVIVAAIAFLWPSYVEFPMDDAYIHFVYAQNLVTHGKLFFSFVDEQGIGITSPLWVFVLAGLYAIGIPMSISAKVMGIMGLTVLTSGLYMLLRSIWKSPFLFFGVFLIAISGNMLWFALSGMETILFLAIGILALLAYREERWIRLGILLGLMNLLRPDGLALVAAIICIDCWVHRRIRRKLLAAILVCTLISAPWFIFLYWRTGHLLPTSALGKRFTFAIALDYISGRNQSLSLLRNLTFLSYPMMWLMYLLEFALGGMSLPPPRITLGEIVGGLDYSISIWAIFTWVILIFPLLYLASSWFFSLRRWLLWRQDGYFRPLLVLALWTALHNIAYMVFMPVPGTASRYGALNHLMLWLILTLGLSRLARYRRLGLAAAGGLLVIATVNTFYWNRVYDANLEHMQNVRVAAARFVHEHLPFPEKCAAIDIGALRYFSHQLIVDLGGLTDPDIHEWFTDHNADLYLVEHGATCLVLPGRMNASNDGWFDFVEILGFQDSRFFELQQIAVYEIDRERWLLGYLPTNNQQESVVIYKLLPKNKQADVISDR